MLCKDGILAGELKGGDILCVKPCNSIKNGIELGIAAEGLSFPTALFVCLEPGDDIGLTVPDIRLQLTHYYQFKSCGDRPSISQRVRLSCITQSKQLFILVKGQRESQEKPLNRNETNDEDVSRINQDEIEYHWTSSLLEADDRRHYYAHVVQFAPLFHRQSLGTPLAEVRRGIGWQLAVVHHPFHQQPCFPTQVHFLKTYSLADLGYMYVIPESIRSQHYGTVRHFSKAELTIESLEDVRRLKVGEGGNGQRVETSPVDLKRSVEATLLFYCHDMLSVSFENSKQRIPNVKAPHYSASGVQGKDREG